MTSTRLSTIAGLLIVVAIVATSILLSLPHPVRSQSSSTPITGYAWSDTTGWISMSGSNYGLSISSTGAVTGYAWSDNLGWISANPSDLSVCPGQASQITNGAWSGWLRAISGNTSESGGWDGCISMSGTNYGVTLNETTGDFSGYAWGDINNGWITFQYATSAFTETPPCESTQGDYCATSQGTQNTTGPQIWYKSPQCATNYVSTCSYQCSNGACVAPPQPQGGLSGGVSISAAPSIVSQGQTVSVQWSVQNVTSCSVSGTNGDSWSGTSGSETSSPITKQTIYTLTCTTLSNSQYTQSVTVNIIPTFQEI